MILEGGKIILYIIYVFYTQTLHVCVFNNNMTCSVLTITMRIDATEKQKFQQVLIFRFILFRWMFPPPIPSEKNLFLSFASQFDKRQQSTGIKRSSSSFSFHSSLSSLSCVSCKWTENVAQKSNDTFCICCPTIVK